MVGIETVFTGFMRSELTRFILGTKTFRISIVIAVALSLYVLLGGLVLIFDGYGDADEGLIYVLISPLVGIAICTFMAGIIWALNPNWKDG